MTSVSSPHDHILTPKITKLETLLYFNITDPMKLVSLNSDSVCEISLFWNQLNRYEIDYTTSYQTNQFYRSNSQFWLTLIFWTQWNWSRVLKRLFVQIDYFSLSIYSYIKYSNFLLLNILNWSKNLGRYRLPPLKGFRPRNHKYEE